jgi:hypothetical protein
MSSTKEIWECPTGALIVALLALWMALLGETFFDES